MNPILTLIAGAAAIYAYHRTGDRTVNLDRWAEHPELDDPLGTSDRGGMVAVTVVLGAVALVVLLALAAIIVGQYR